MQHKFLWGGAALAVLGAATGFVAVDHAITNPNCLLARFGVAAIFAGLNPNPLSDVDNSITTSEPVTQSEVSVAPSNGETGDTVFNPAEETIEPIQVECLPPATIEPPRVEGNTEFGGEFGPQINVIPDGPMPMAYATEDFNAGTPPAYGGSGNPTWSGWWFNPVSSCTPAAGQTEESTQVQQAVPPAKAKAPLKIKKNAEMWDFSWLGSMIDTMEYRPSDAGREAQSSGKQF